MPAAPARTIDLTRFATWRPIPPERGGAALQQRLERILKSWEGTPYTTGQQSKGQAVDCVRFVGAVLDEWRGRAPEAAVPRLPPDASFHDPELARGALAAFLRLYGPWDDVRLEPGCFLEPGDTLAVGRAGPGHAIIVGAGRNELWEIAGPGRKVRRGGFGIDPGMLVHASAYRWTGREAWPTQRP